MAMFTDVSKISDFAWMLNSGASSENHKKVCESRRHFITYIL